MERYLLPRDSDLLPEHRKQVALDEEHVGIEETRAKHAQEKAEAGAGVDSPGRVAISIGTLSCYQTHVTQ
jgi:hypothetical protein